MIVELECTGGGSGKAGVWELRDDVPENEARRELQEDTRAGITGRGRNGGRNRGLELGAREELLEELLWLKGGEK